MRSPGQRIHRNLSQGSAAAPTPDAQPARIDAPRVVRRTVIDFSSLGLPEDVRLALVLAFWGHLGARSPRSIKFCWTWVLAFNRFATESGAVGSLADLERRMLLRYIEWLNAQQSADGAPWAISTRSAAYSALRQLLRWLERCRPDLVSRIDYPFTPFPGRGSDRPPRATPTARVLRCDQRFGGIVPSSLELQRCGNHPLQLAVRRWGGAKQIEPCLYPRAVSLLPYYLAILIHAAGNPEPIAELGRDCLQDVPLLENRQALVWFKARAGRLQRRSFERDAPFEPRPPPATNPGSPACRRPQRVARQPKRAPPARLRCLPRRHAGFEPPALVRDRGTFSTGTSACGRWRQRHNATASSSSRGCAR